MALNPTPASTTHSPLVTQKWSGRTPLLLFTDNFPAQRMPLNLMSSHIDDFETGVLTPWTITTVEVAGAATEVTGSSVLLVTNGTADNDSDQFQRADMLTNTIVGKDLYFQARVKVGTAAETELLIGLAVVDTTLIVSAPSDGFYFSTAATDADLLATTRASSTGAGVSTSTDLEDDTWVTLGILFSGTSLFYYVDNVLKSTQTTNIPAVGAALVPSFAVRNGTIGAKTLSVDYIAIFQER